MCEERISLLVSLVPIPLIDLGFWDVQTRCECFDLFLRPVGTAIELSLQNLTLEPVHTRHQSFSVRFKLVPWRLEQVVKTIGLEKAEAAEVVVYLVVSQHH